MWITFKRLKGEIIFWQLLEDEVEEGFLWDENCLIPVWKLEKRNIKGKQAMDDDRFLAIMEILW